MIRRAALIVAAYAALTVVMTWPFVNHSDFATASYGGDARLISGWPEERRLVHGAWTTGGSTGGGGGT